jgi:hypothetical protein
MSAFAGLGTPSATAYPATFAEKSTLSLTSGRLIVADPATLFADAKPLPLTLPIGDYPVSWTPDRVQLRLSEQRPQYWVRRPGFSSISGLGCLLDAEALAAFTDLGDEPVDEYELLIERFAVSGTGLVGFRGLTVFAAPRGDFSIRVGCRSGTVVRLDCEIITKDTYSVTE